MIALLILACATDLDTAERADPGPVTTEGPAVAYYVPAGGSGPAGPLVQGRPYTVEAHDLGSIVAAGPDGRLCSVSADLHLVDVDDDGRCDLVPPVAIWVLLW